MNDKIPEDGFWAVWADLLKDLDKICELWGLSAFATFELLASILLFVAVLVFGKVPLSYNLNNLKVRWKTTLLTALAFTMVVALLTVMTAFVNGMIQLTKTTGHPDNVMVLSQGATDEVFSEVRADVGDLENLDRVAKTAEGVPLISRETYFVVTTPILNPQPGKPKRRFLQLRGIDRPLVSSEVHRVALHDGGSWFSESGVRDSADGAAAVVECVVGEGLARELARDRVTPENPNPAPLKVGETFKLADRDWLVTGIMQSSGLTFDSEIWGKQGLTAQMFGKSAYSTLLIRANSPTDATELAKFLKDDYGKASLSSQVETTYYESLQGTNVVIVGAIQFVTIILGLGGVFGVMNTMYAAVSQRKRDIGVLRLMGYRKYHVLASFLFESLVIAFLGCLLGFAIGSLFHGATATSILSSGGGGGRTVVLKLVVDQSVFVVGLTVALVMGVVGGLFPAFVATRLKPLESLR